MTAFGEKRPGGSIAPGYMFGLAPPLQGTYNKAGVHVSVTTWEPAMLLLLAHTPNEFPTPAVQIPLR